MERGYSNTNSKSLDKNQSSNVPPYVYERTGKRSSLLSNAFDYEPMARDERTKATSGQEIPIPNRGIIIHRKNDPTRDLPSCQPRGTKSDLPIKTPSTEERGLDPKLERS